MQRSKAAMSVEVKQVIGALCRLLAATGLEAVPTPEMFRQAKFGGGTEVEDQFWQLLTNVLQKANIVSCEARAQLGGGAPEHRKLTAARLWQTSYHADWMYGREGGEGGRLSSRDLLMALGWVLATGTLERLLTQRIQQLDKTLLTRTSVNTQLSNGLQLDPASLKTLKWLIGSLRHQGRTLLSIQEERAGLLHSVLFAIVSSLESSDQSSTVLKEDCAYMCQLCDLLQAYVSWRQVEKVFWTWMDSVVDCCLTDTVVEKSTQAPDGSSQVCHHGIWRLEKLDEMLLRLPTGQVSYTCKGQSNFLKNNGLSILKNTAKTLINQRAASKDRLSQWEKAKLPEDFAFQAEEKSLAWLHTNIYLYGLGIQRGDLEHMVTKGQSRGRWDAENRVEGGERLWGAPYTSSLPPVLSSLPSLPSIPQAYRARLLTERSVKFRNHPAERVHGGARARTPDKLSSSDATQLLLQIKALLLDRRDRQRLASRMQLQEMVGRLDELVLIPP